jgi:hypothetical protein
VLDAERRHRLILVATAPNGGVWRYTEEPPGSDAWTAPWYDDRDWRSGKGGFGAPGTPGARIGTEWRSGAIWLRREFDVPADFALDRAWLEMHHDEAIAVYVNGAEVLRESGYLTRYVTRPVDLAGLLRPGETNTLAVHCRQSEGGQYVDAGLLALEARGPEGKSP